MKWSLRFSLLPLTYFRVPKPLVSSTAFSEATVRGRTMQIVRVREAISGGQEAVNRHLIHEAKRLAGERQELLKEAGFQEIQ